MLLDSNVKYLIGKIINKKVGKKMKYYFYYHYFFDVLIGNNKIEKVGYPRKKEDKENKYKVNDYILIENHFNDNYNVHIVNGELLKLDSELAEAGMDYVSYMRKKKVNSILKNT